MNSRARMLASMSCSGVDYVPCSFKIKKEVELVHQAGKKFGLILTSAFLPILDDILATGC
jgi:hypothetical protein